MDSAFFAAVARVGNIGCLNDKTFNRMRDAYHIAWQSQAMHQEAWQINLRAGYGHISARRGVEVEAL